MLLHKEFGYSLDYILHDLNMDRGWLLFSYAMVNDPVAKFSGIKMKNSPISLEIDILMNELYKMKSNQNK